jgi:hypothetical protein
MQIIFRKIHGQETPAAGELWVRPRHEADRGTCGLALLVLERGSQSLEQGTGPWTHLVISAAGTSPNLDEMLAASLALCQIEGKTIPEGFKAIARYAEIARKGLKPSDLPPEKSLEGMFLAVLNFNGPDLNDPRIADRFLASWQRMFTHLLEAAQAGRDPFTTPLFETCHDLAQERAYLTSDQEVYRQDVLRGERWQVKLPDGPADSSGLLLRKPRSLLFKYWARRDPHAPKGAAYLFLAVEWERGEWVFSTDPVMRLSLKSLAETLDAAESTANPERPANNPWYDGKDHQHTLAASPKGGSRLPEKQILRIVRTWARAKPAHQQAAVGLAIASFALGAMLVGLALTFFKPVVPTVPSVPVKDPHIVETTDARPKGLVLKEILVDGVARPRSSDDKPADLAMLPYFAETVELEQNGRIDFPVENDFDRPVKLRVTVAPADASIKTLNAAWKITLDGKTLLASKNQAEGVSELKTKLPANPGSFRFQLTHLDQKDAKAKVRIECLPDPSKSRLHILAIGVSEYAMKKKSLRWADKDAVDLVNALQLQNKSSPLFSEIIVHRKPYKGRPIKGLLTNDEATQSNILTELASLRESALEDDLALVFFSGHGKQQERSRHYFFLPHDFDAGKELDASAVSWDAMRRYVVEMPCPTVIILDTCHSGAAGMGSRGTATKTELKRAVEEAMVHFAKARRGIGILAACLSDQSAIEKEDWQHGVLSLAILECVTGRRLASTGPKSPPLPVEQSRAGVISLHDLHRYAEARVAELMGEEQAVDLRRFQDLDPRQIPIAAFERKD